MKHCIDKLRRQRTDGEMRMSTDLSFAADRLAYRTRFVLVNDRVPRTGEHCALCGGIVEKGYVRDSRTG